MMITSEKAWGSKASLAIALAVMLGITGCGGSSSSGGGTPDSGGDGDGNGNGNGNGNVSEQQATIGNEEDAERGAEATVESARQAIIEDGVPDLGAPGGVRITQESHQDWMISHNLDIAELSLQPTGAFYDVPGDCGGSASVNLEESNASQHRIVYNDYCTSDGGGNNSIINGTFDWFGQSNMEQGEWGYTFDYSVTYQGETNHYNGTYRCNGNDYTGCSYISNYEGRNGRTYRSENVDVSSNGDAYDVSARVYDEEIGYVDYEASNLLLCDGGYGFSSGSITVTDSSGGNVLTITFSDCNSYTLTYNGTGYTIDY